MSLYDLNKTVLRKLIFAYDEYIQDTQFNDTHKPMTIQEFLDEEFIEEVERLTA